MSTTISTAGVILKDVNGNVGKVNGLTDNDVATVNSAISTINKIAPSGSLPDATADAKGVVYAATKGVSVVQPESGKTYALTTESTDQLVTIANAQTITGEKTFSDATTFKGNVNASSLYVRTTTDGSSNTPFYCISYNTTTDTGTTTNGLVYGDENTTINFGFSKEVTVPTVDASTSNTKAASTAFVHNAIKADTTHAQITGDNTFSGNQNITGDVSVTGNLSSTGTVTSGGSTVVTESTFDNQLTGKVLKTYPTSSDGRYIYASDDVPTALGIGKGSVDMANATSVTVPDVYATVPEPTTSNLEAASVSYVKQYVDNHASSGVSPVFVDSKGRDFSQIVANSISIDCSELIGTDAAYATFDDLYTDVINQNYDKIHVGQTITIPNVSWSYGDVTYTRLVLRVLDLRYACFFGTSYSFGILVMLDPLSHPIRSAAHSSATVPNTAYSGIDLCTTTLPAIYDALAGSSAAPLYNKISTVKFDFCISTVWTSSALPFYYNGGTSGAVSRVSSFSGNLFIPSASLFLGYTPPCIDRATPAAQRSDILQIAAFRNLVAMRRLLTIVPSDSYWLSDIASSSEMAYVSISPYSSVPTINKATLTNKYRLLPCFVIGRTSAS